MIRTKNQKAATKDIFKRKFIRVGAINALLLTTCVGLFSSCKHEPILSPLEPVSDIVDIWDDPGPTVICDSTTVYFQQQVLPLLISNCAIPGCHNLPTDDNDDIQITSYETLMNSGVVQDGDLWENINEDDPDKIMPPPPQTPLTPEQIALIGTWLQQGAQNNSCVASGCDTTNVTYSNRIRPLVQQRCQGCHSGSTPQGGLDFTSWAVLNSTATDGRLAAAIQHLPSATAMPPSGPMLPACTIDQFLIWIGEGAPNN